MSAESDALAAVEQRVRDRVTAQLGWLVDRFGATLAAAVRADEHTSALDLLSRPDVHTALSGLLATAQTAVETQIRAGHAAAAQLGRVTAGRELGERTAAAAGDDLIDAITADVGRAFTGVYGDIHNLVRIAHDGITGDGAPAARVLATNAALKRAVRGLGVRVGAAATVAVNRGFSDAHMAAYTAYAQVHPDAAGVKRWQVTSANPCPTCLALDGVEVGLDDEFDHTLTADPGVSTPAVYRDLLAPPRHPNCRCRLVIDLGSDLGAVEAG